MLNIPLPIWLSNVHFVLAILAFFAFFSTGALHADSWATVRHARLLFVRALGYFGLAGWAVVQGVAVATDRSLTALSDAMLGVSLVVLVANYFAERLPGRPAVKAASGQGPAAPAESFVDGGQTVIVPVKRSRSTRVRRRVVALAVVPVRILARFASPLLGFALSGRIWYQATVKLERGRKTLAAAWFFLACSWGLAAAALLPVVRTGPLVSLADPFGGAWVAARITEAFGVFLLLRWAWGFLRFRLFPQVYLTVVGAMLATTVVSAVVLVSVLAHRTQVVILDTLETDARVFAFTLEELQAQVRLVASAVSARAGLPAAVVAGDTPTVAAILGDPLREYGVAAVTILNAGGEVLHAVGGDLRPGEQVGTTDPAAVRAFQGTAAATARVHEGPQLPVVLVRAASPLVRDGRPSGAILVDFPVDAAFLDQVKQLTGLEVVLYGGRRLAATTVRDAQGQPRLGVPGEERSVLDAVFGNPGNFRGAVTLGGEPFLAAALPLTDIDQVRTGALVVGLSESTFLQSLAGAMRTALVSALVLMGVSLLPLYGIARGIARYQQS